MSSEKNIIKISEDDLKKHLSEDELTDYLENQEAIKLEEVTPQIKNDLVVYTENVFYNREIIRKIPGERGFFDGRKKMLGMYCSEDLVSSDEFKAIK